MTVVLLRIGDGRDAYHERSWASARRMLPRVDHIVTIDDREHALGFAGAIQAGWDEIAETGADWIFHLEMDFEFLAPVPLARMIALLEREPHLAQIVLKRQPVNESEHAAGGIVEQHPDDYTEREDGGDTWTEHRRFFSTNPSLYSTDLLRLRWPQEPQSEGMFTHRLLADPLLRFAFWGGKFDPPTVHHIGDVRSGTGY